MRVKKELERRVTSLKQKVVSNSANKIKLQEVDIPLNEINEMKAEIEQEEELIDNNKS